MVIWTTLAADSSMPLVRNHDPNMVKPRGFIAEIVGMNSSGSMSFNVSTSKASFSDEGPIPRETEREYIEIAN